MDEQKPNYQSESAFKQSILCKETHSISRFTLNDFSELIRYLLQIKQAAARANADSGHLSDAKAIAIFNACENLHMRTKSSIFMVDVLQGGGGFAINGNINEAILFELATFSKTPFTTRDINHSQSSADVCATALRLGLYDLATTLNSSIENLNSALNDFVSDWGQISTLARTCWQDALSITMADRFLGIVHGFSICAKVLLLTAQDLLMIPLGTTVLGTSTGASTSYKDRVIFHLSDILSRPLYRSKNAVSGAQNFPDLGLLANSVKTIAENVIRFGLDLRILNSGPKGGLREIELPKVVQSSSFFPKKFNPTIAETAIQGAVFAHSMAHAMEFYRVFPEIDLNVFEWSAGIKLYLGMETLTASIDCLRNHCIKGMAVNEKRCQELSSFAHPH